MGNNPTKLSTEQLNSLSKSSNFSRKELSQLHKQFVKENPSGVILQKDFMKITKQLGFQDKFFSDLLFQTFDENDDGVISFNELVVALSVTTRGTPDEKLKFIFNVYDVDGNGFIDQSELSSIVGSIYRMVGDSVSLPPDCNTVDKLVKKIFSEIDENGDGKLSFDEFSKKAKTDPTFSLGLGLYK